MGTTTRARHIYYRHTTLRQGGEGRVGAVT
jgi:hypothetical protein